MENLENQKLWLLNLRKDLSIGYYCKPKYSSDNVSITEYSLEYFCNAFNEKCTNSDFRKVYIFTTEEKALQKLEQLCLMGTVDEYDTFF